MVKSGLKPLSPLANAAVPKGMRGPKRPFIKNAKHIGDKKKWLPTQGERL